MEKRIVTLAELKGVKVYLRNSIERNTGDLSTVRKYLAVNRKVKELESMLLWSILSLILIFSSGGCIENTMRGAGRMIQGAGELVTGVGKDVVRGTDGYSNEN